LPCLIPSLIQSDAISISPFCTRSIDLAFTPCHRLGEFAPAAVDIIGIIVIFKPSISDEKRTAAVIQLGCHSMWPNALDYGTYVCRQDH